MPIDQQYLFTAVCFLGIAALVALQVGSYLELCRIRKSLDAVTPAARAGSAAEVPARPSPPR